MDVTIEEFEKMESFAGELFEQAGWATADSANFERIEEVVERALYENTLRDTSTFLFEGMTAALHGVGGALLGGVQMADVDYRA